MLAGRAPDDVPPYNTRVKSRFGGVDSQRQPAFDELLESRLSPILQAPEAFLTLSFRLDLTIYRRYNPRT